MRRDFISQRIRPGLFAVTMAAAGGLYALSVALAAGGATLSVGSSAVTTGNNTQLTVSIDPGGNDIASLEVGLSFPADKLKCVGLTTTVDFPITLPGDVCGGGVYAARARVVDTASNPSGYKTAGQVVVITLKSLAAGTAPVTFNASTTVLDLANNAVPVSLNGGTVTVINPLTLPPASGSSSGGVKNGGAPVTNSRGQVITAPSVQTSPVAIAQNSAGADTRPPLITHLKITDITDNGATVRWTTDEPANSLVDYGPTAAYGQVSQAGDLSTQHVLGIQSALLQKGMVYHVRVKSTDAAGNTTVSLDKTFQTTGYDITLIVKDESGRFLKGAAVSYRGQQKQTDDQGRADFTNVGFGPQKIAIALGGNTTYEVIEVGQNDSQGRLKEQRFVLRAAADGGLSKQIAAALAGLAIVAGSGLVIWRQRQMARPPTPPLPPEWQSQ